MSSSNPGVRKVLKQLKNQTCLLLIFGLTLSVSDTMAQDIPLPEPVMDMEQRSEIRRVFLRMAQEREKLVQYTCTIHSELTLNPSSKSWSTLAIARKVDPKSTIYHFEYSKMDGAMLCYLRQSATSPIIALAGYTRNKEFSYYASDNSPQSIIVRNRKERDATIRELNVPGYFDPRTVGFGTYGDHVTNSTVEQLLADCCFWDNGVIETKIESGPNGLIFLHNIDQRIEIDTKRGYWPVHYTFAPPSSSNKDDTTTWSTTVKEFSDGVYLPIQSEIRSGPSSQPHYVRKLTFSWSNLDSILPVGLKRLEVLAQENNLPLRMVSSERQ